MEEYSLHSLWFWDKQYSLTKESNTYSFFDNRWKNCLQIKEEIGMRIHALLNIQAMKDNRLSKHYEQISEIYNMANCHGTALYTLGHCEGNDRDKLDVDGDMFIYDEEQDRVNKKIAFEKEYLKPYSLELFKELSLPLGIHFTNLFQRHSAILLWEDKRNSEYYVSFQKIAYWEPWIIASFRKEILNLRKDIQLIPNNYK